MTAISTTTGPSMADLARANLGEDASLTAKDLTRIKIPAGGSTIWTWSEQGEDRSDKSLVGRLVVVCREEQILWPSLQATTGSPPLMTAHGNLAVRQGSDYGDLDAEVIEAARRDDGLYDTAKIPYFSWVNNTCRAKSRRVVGLLREGDVLPVFVSLPGTSLRAMNTLLREITKRGLYHWQATVELVLERRKGARSDYSVLSESRCRVVSEDRSAESVTFKSRYTDVFTTVVCPPLESRVRSVAAISSDVPF